MSVAYEDHDHAHLAFGSTMSVCIGRGHVPSHTLFLSPSGPFHGLTSGETHNVNADGMWWWSAYRIQDENPFFFSDGLFFDWRVGDVTDPATGLKCTQLNDTMVGMPQASNVTAVTWLYAWPL